ncbi:DUF397 domain-containing protein [Streptomyces syringium]|uniref:DUF397 domain-containing protein n=1 Tax=Streptomyces syringium TaxID=76729 RepID=UPI003693EC83
MSRTSEPVGSLADWFKSSYSNGSGGECLEASLSKSGTAVRDSKNPGGAVLVFSHGAWMDFVRATRIGQLS